MTHFHSVVRPGAATLERKPEMRVLDAKSYGLAVAVHTGLALVIAIAAWAKPVHRPPPYLEAEIYFSNLTYPIEPPAPPSEAQSPEKNADDPPSVLRDRQSNVQGKGLIADNGKPILSQAKTEAKGAAGTALDHAPEINKSMPMSPWELSPQITRAETPAASPDRVANAKPPAPPEIAKTTPAPGRDIKKSTALGPKSDHFAPPRPGGEGIILVAPIPYIKPRPAYPIKAMQNGLEGTVVVRVLISATGTILETKISKSSGSAMLDEAARQGIMQWKFHPGRQASGAVTTAIDVPIEFTLPNPMQPMQPMQNAAGQFVPIR